MCSTRQEIFHRLDVDGSGSLDYGEVVTGLRSIGIVFNPGDLERMFSVACDPEEETVSLHGLDFILRVLKCSVVPEDPNFASDVDTCIQVRIISDQKLKYVAEKLPCVCVRRWSMARTLTIHR